MSHNNDFKINNEFEAKAFFASLSDFPNFNLLDKQLTSISLNKSPFERTTSFYYFQKLIFEKYMNNPPSRIIEIFHNSLNEYISSLMFSIECFGFNVEGNPILSHSLELLGNDDISLKRITSRAQTNYTIKLLAFYFYFCTNNEVLKMKFKNVVLDRISEEIKATDFNLLSDNLKNAFFEEAKEQFKINFLPKDFL